MTADFGLPASEGVASPAGEGVETLAGVDVETLAGVGEGEVLRRIFPRLPHADAELLGPGDDAAVLAAPDGRYVVTTDMMIHGPDFRTAWSMPHDLGWKAAMTNLADVAAMGARPTALVVAIAAPLDTPVPTLLGIADGLRDACALAAPGCGVVGGDLSVSSTLTLAVSAFGDLEGRPPVTRSGARPGDVVAVAGPLGRAGAGIWLLFRDAVTRAAVPRAGAASGAGEPDAALGRAVRGAHPALLEAQLAPTPPIGAGAPAAVGGATAMLDVSDGLVLDARRIAQASGCSIRFDPDALESEALALTALDDIVGDHALDFVLAGGEDHALLATFRADAPLPAGFRRLGEVVGAEDGSPAVFIGDVAAADRGGWDPYADWNGHAG